MTTEAALAKLHFLLSQDLSPEQIRTLMQQDLRGELSL
jgi:L-asparaginase